MCGSSEGRMVYVVKKHANVTAASTERQYAKTTFSLDKMECILFFLCF